MNSTTELEESEVHHIVDVIDYVPNAAVSKSILKKITGNITVFAFNAGQALTLNKSPFRKYIQIIDGVANVTIEDRQYKLKSGDGIVVPANVFHSFNADEQFKMISTTIKSGYED